MQPKRFKTLLELVSLYLQPSQGLVTTLLYAVEREETAVSDDRDYSGNAKRIHSGTPAHSHVLSSRGDPLLFCDW